MIGRPLTCLLLFSVIALGFSPQDSIAHGSVSPDDDLCIIKIGFYRAHFKIYLPQSRGHSEFCEDIPETGEAIFIMEYEHRGLGDTPIDFRVIRNTTGKANFTILEDVEMIEDLEAVTLLHHPASIQPDVFTYLHQFDVQGQFVGIITVQQPETGKVYTAVFPFEVGYTGIPKWVWFVLGAIVLQLNFFWMNGSIARWRERKSGRRGLGASHA
jgi:hypothetical protein